MKTGSVVDDWDPIPLSCLSQAGFCLRRAALITNERVWAESADTIKGRLEHERVHTQRVERRGNSAKLYEFPVYSRELGIAGKCDCIEAEADPQGCRISALDYPVALYPVEYKHGKLREEREYEIQLCAQAMCLEEMFSARIRCGAIFYTTSHRRYPIEFTEELRNSVKETIRKVESLRHSFSIPSAEYGTKCKACSLREYCMPGARRSASDYCAQMRMEAVEEDKL